MEKNESQVVTETSMRSVLKGFTWRLVATFSTIVIAYLITGETKTALQIGGIEFVAKIAVYYLHERIWLRIPFGIKKVSNSAECEI
jgi:adenylylsulfate kinase